MPKQDELDTTYLKMAETWAQLSKALRKKVGCLIVKNGAIISDGYNGTPSGFDNKCEEEDPKSFDGELITKPEVLHAESNAITKLAKSTQSSSGATLYNTISPCVECSKLIIQAGIKRVVYKDWYRNHDGIKLLKQADIKVDQK
tara:strand:- start:56 stop:487 length:432 start_codon:yes stop_codon:yes gene_type:complete